MTDFVLVDGAGVIVNRIVLDEGATWDCPAELSLIPDGGFDIGGSIVAGSYSPPPGNPAPALPPAPPSILSQDLMAQFTASDAAKIQSAVTNNPQFWLLWSALQAQKDPMGVANPRFLAGWNALIQVVGADRMTAIAGALGVTVV